MMKLHYFFPENDLALAANIAQYTAPVAAQKLRLAGAALPLWYGDTGDAVLTQGVSSQWFEAVCSRFDLGVSLWDRSTSEYTPTPWGWSKAVRQIFSDYGFKAGGLPDDERLAYLRNLSHRRTASELNKLIAQNLPYPIAPAAVECNTVAEVGECLKNYRGGIVIKLPWSSSGRGVQLVDDKTFDSRKRQIEGMIHRQGSVLAEPYLQKTLDFAMLFTIAGSVCRYDGLSLFHNQGLGAYAGNTLAPQSELKKIIESRSVALEPLQSAICKALEHIAPEYEGPLGVDMMAVENHDFTIAPTVEINFRMTMGHLCRIVYQKYIEPGAYGTFNILPQTSAGKIPQDVFNGRLRSGILDLTPPGSEFTFQIDLPIRE